MVIMGIDPGTARVGWAVISIDHSRPRALSYGCIMTSPQAPERRLLAIHVELTSLLENHKPHVLALEDVFFATNAKTAIPVGQARGVVLLACAQHNITVISYAPRAIKLAIAGDGMADKTQVTKMVCQILALDSVPKPDDTSDALAIALTHAYSYKLKGKLA